MKIQVTKELADKLLREGKVSVDSGTPWWVIVLKVVAYLIGLLLAGAGTPAALAGVNSFLGGIL